MLIVAGKPLEIASKFAFIYWILWIDTEGKESGPLLRRLLAIFPERFKGIDPGSLCTLLKYCFSWGLEDAFRFLTSFVTDQMKYSHAESIILYTNVGQ